MTKGFQIQKLNEEHYLDSLRMPQYAFICFLLKSTLDIQNPMGYVLYEVKGSKMKIEEFVALNDEGRDGLWNFICQHDS